MSSDQQFTALGPAIIGFQTDATEGPIDRGAEIVGNQRGVLGQCATPGGPEAVGVCGLGAPLAGGNTPNPGSSPTTGVLGLGGRRDDLQNHDRGPHGGGVVGVAGARPPQPGQTVRPVPPFEDTAHVGVFGLGGDAEHRETGPPGVGPSGPLFAGPGVLGRGGKAIGFSGPTSVDPTRDGVGVAGVSGSQDIPAHSEMMGVGVFGKGTAVGVSGVSTEVLGRGGVFSCASAAQVRLQPHEEPVHSPIVDVTPKGFEVYPGRDEFPPANLPRNGLPGDLLATTSGFGNDEKTTLWFCQRGRVGGSGGEAAAQWREVLMGPAFPGTVEDA